MSHKLKYVVGSGFTSGKLIPNAPGTEGSIVAALFGTLAWYFFGPIAITALFLASLIAAYWAAPWYIQTYGDDPGSFVMDEWGGQLLSMHILWIIPIETPSSIQLLLIVSTLLLFRIIDIRKPLGIRRLEAIPGATGVIADDLLAGFYTFLTLFFVILAVL